MEQKMSYIAIFTCFYLLLYIWWVLNYIISTEFPYLGRVVVVGVILLTVKSDIMCQILWASPSCSIAPKLWWQDPIRWETTQKIIKKLLPTWKNDLKDFQLKPTLAVMGCGSSGMHVKGRVKCVPTGTFILALALTDFSFNNASP